MHFSIKRFSGRIKEITLKNWACKLELHTELSVGKHVEKLPVEWQRRRHEDTIKIGHKLIYCVDVYWIEPAQDRNQW